MPPVVPVTPALADWDSRDSARPVKVAPVASCWLSVFTSAPSVDSSFPLPTPHSCSGRRLAPTNGRGVGLHAALGPDDHGSGPAAPPAGLRLALAGRKRGQPAARAGQPAVPLPRPPTDLSPAVHPLPLRAWPGLRVRRGAKGGGLWSVKGGQHTVIPSLLHLAAVRVLLYRPSTHLGLRIAATLLACPPTGRPATHA